MAHPLPSQPRHEQDVSPIEGPSTDFPPPPPAHRTPVGMHVNGDFSQLQAQRPRQHDPNNYSDYTPPSLTSSSGNSGEGVAGPGINGFAVGPRNAQDRESGMQAIRDMHSRNAGPSRSSPQGTPFSDRFAYDSPTSPRPIHPQTAYGPNGPLAAGTWSSNSSQQSMPLSTQSNPYPYADSPYNRYSSSNLNLAPAMGAINPNDVADDDDWGMTPTQQKRRSFVPFGSGSRDGVAPAAAAAAATGGAAGGLAAGAAAQDASGRYDAVPTGDGSLPPGHEKSEWLDRQNHGKKKVMWIVSGVIAFLVVGAIIGGVLGSVLHKGGGGGGSGGGKNNGAGAVIEDNKNDLSINSDEIQKLMNNKNLHKVFPGMDYTPLNSQYPDCLHVPPSQNNITRDMAVMSQLTNAVRLYGTDCNQTAMVLHAIDRLQLKDMKVWLGVWLGNNDTTNARQVSQMWDIIDTYGGAKFKGVIIGNEVLYRKDMNETALLTYITDIKANLTKHSIDLPIATSDLGDNWTQDMATKVNAVMSNVHPFFAGVAVDLAAAWTWNFWQQHDVYLTANNQSIKQIIAEVGWPSGGGNNCGASTCTSSTQGSISGIDEMNKFMSDWICPSMKNATEYFWFSAFDEPWKVRYNEKGKEWEDKWGLMDVDRNLKTGVTIPDCGGQTVP